MNLDDPRLTAYALDELDEYERLEVEAELKTDEAARSEVDTIRRSAGKLTAELDAEPCPRLEPEQRFVIHAQLTPAPEAPRDWWKALWWVAGLGFAVVAVSLFLPAMATSRAKPRPLAMSQRVEIETMPVQPVETPDPYSNVREFDYQAPSLGGGSGTFGQGAGGHGLSFEKSPAFSIPPAAPLPLPSNGEGIGIVKGSDEYLARLQPASPTTGLGEGKVGTTGGRGPESGGLAMRDGPARAQELRRYSGKLYQQEYADADYIAPISPGTESYSPVRENQFVSVTDQPLSTFGLDVDTASYANVRRFLSQGQLPPRDAVRIEEMLNYFTYDYPRPRGNEPFSLYVEMAECPWNPAHRLALVGLKAKDIAPRNMQPMNLVFLIDVSGSMADRNKLPLVKEALRLLVRQLTARDRVAIVVYASNARVLLPSTRGDDHETILEAIESLEAGGTTNGGEGIQRAYRQATGNFIEGGVNRLILCTDGDFNVGITDQRELVRLIEQQARSGVFLSVFGFGMGNLKDSTMQKLADKGNGHYAYIDDLDEARKMFVDQMRSTLVTVAKDAKLQIEFNPALVESYRLIGYEKRMLRAQDFNNDRKDAGDIGAGHTVTALYEIVPTGAPLEPGIDPLKYQPGQRRSTGAELMTVKLRHKEPDAGKSQLLTAAVKDTQTSWRRTSDDFRFAAAVACFGMTLRDSEYRAGATLDLAAELAGSARGRDEKGYRMEFVEMVRQARELGGRDR